jgi:hypothetical protein
LTKLCAAKSMRFFGGLTEEEIAAALGVSMETAPRDWRRPDRG